MNTSEDTAADAAVTDLQAARPDSGIEHARMRASLKQKLFGAPQEPVRLGRFVLMDRLGQGGMGVVYSAYDPDLDRRVALKLLRTGFDPGSQRARERLLREAQALARLSHPNVVPVYEVGVLEEQVFIVMEFVVGHTLREWAAADERAWRQVLDAYRQAGQGLAAAHAVGLVHRDFKPDNVQVGDDGRIRVLDFGLARGQPEDEGGEDSGDEAAGFLDPGDDGAALETTAPLGPKPPASGQEQGRGARAGGPDSAPSGEHPSNRRLQTPLTATGAVLGTPAYMPPEQFRGARVGPASDQFSFCVSLYEGLYGQRPFAGETVSALRENMRQGTVRPPPRTSRVPRWLFPILYRGLAREPGDRYPSMDALLAALGRDPARTRRRWLLAILIAGLLGVSIYSLGRSRPAAIDMCQGAARELDGIWDPDRRAALARVFSATGRAYAAQAWPRIAAGLDRYAETWVAMHQDACRAHQRGAQSGALLDRRMSCLGRRKVALASAVAVLQETDAASLQHAVEVMHELPAVAYCADVEALAAEVPPPEDPAVAARAHALRERLSRAKALEDAGRYADALALASTLAGDAEALGYRPLWAELLLLEGRITLAMGKRDDAVAPLRRATALGLATGMKQVGLEALARGIFAEATSIDDPPEDPGEVLRPVYIAEALLEQMPEAVFVHALLLNNTGVVHMVREDRVRARAAFERALAIKRRASGSIPVELSVVQSNLALVTSDPEKRAALLESAGRELERALGPAHPRTLELRVAHGHYTLDPARARSILDTTCGLYERYHPELRSQLADCLYYLAFLDAEQGAAADERLRAAEGLQEAAALFPDERPWLRDLARGQALLFQGDPGAALPVLDAAIRALRERAEHWWDRKRLAEALLARGMSLLALNRHRAAITALEQAREGFEQVAAINHNAETQRRLARTWMVLATALWDAQGAGRATGNAQRARARELASRALAWYRRTGAGHERQEQEIEAWLQVRNLGEAAAGPRE